MTVAAALSVVRVSMAYPTRRGQVQALRDCSAEIAAGDLHVVVGPSGCGKTTLLGAIAGFHGIAAGEIRVDGRLLCGPGAPQAAPGADRVVVFQHSTLFPWRTVLANVTYGPLVQGRCSRADARELARERLRLAGLAGLEERYPAELSSGTQRRVEIVRALVNDPSVLLLDEPFRGMDAITQGIMHEALLELYDRAGTTVVFITHDIEEAVFLGSHVSVMSARPGAVKATVEIDLPRPRDITVRSSARYGELVAEVLGQVRGEATRAFEIGDREAA
jgi:NitT/TauT family transport system ATP-binding protein